MFVVKKKTFEFHNILSSFDDLFLYEMSWWKFTVISKLNYYIYMQYLYSVTRIQLLHIWYFLICHLPNSISSSDSIGCFVKYFGMHFTNIFIDSGDLKYFLIRGTPRLIVFSEKRISLHSIHFSWLVSFILGNFSMTDSMLDDWVSVAWPICFKKALFFITCFLYQW